MLNESKKEQLRELRLELVTAFPYEVDEIRTSMRAIKLSDRSKSYLIKYSHGIRARIKEQIVSSKGLVDIAWNCVRKPSRKDIEKARKELERVSQQLYKLENDLNPLFIEYDACEQLLKNIKPPEY